jgi:RimJ/RimL family protein N-acetyltransferase
VVTLRPAAPQDAALLYAWRVDADTARQSVAPPPTSLDDHRAWLEAQLRDPRVALYVGYDDERRVEVGTLRIDRHAGDEIELSITVAPEQRGRGYSHDLIACGIRAAAGNRIVARVKPDNVRSLRAFRALGFDRVDGGGDLVRLVHEPASTAGGAKA